MNANEFIKQRIQNEWNGKVFLGFYEDEEIDMFEMMELYAQFKAENLLISDVSESLVADIKRVTECLEKCEGGLDMSDHRLKKSVPLVNEIRGKYKF